MTKKKDKTLNFLDSKEFKVLASQKGNHLIVIFTNGEALTIPITKIAKSLSIALYRKNKVENEAA